MKILKSTTIIPQNLYVERKADLQLRNVINDMGRPASILVSRQMGKTNLLLNAKYNLSNENKLFIYIDLSSTFFPSIKECFRYVIDSAIDTNSIFEEIEETISENREKNKLPNREHEQELLLLLRQFKGDIVIVLDEIDSMIKYDFSDQFFSQIRSVYFASRTNYPEFNRLTYILSGVLEPSEIIHDKTKSPFNISEKIYLNDFTKEEYLSFITKTKLDFLKNDVIEKIYEWTNGHPRITWDIVSKLEDKFIDNKEINVNDVDNIIDDLYIKHSDNPPIDNIKNLISENVALAQSILDIKQKIYLNISDAIKSKLYLFGIIEIVDNEAVTLKNKILEENLSDDFLTDIIYSQKSPYEIAQSFFNDGKYDEAIVAYERCLNSEEATEKEKNISRINAGYCLLYLGNNKSALEFMNEVNISKEEDPYSYYINIGNKAVCYLNLKNYEESLNHCDILLEYKQALFDIRAYYYKANLYSLYDYKNNKDLMLENVNRGLSVISSYTAKDKAEQNEINNFLVNLHLLEYTYYMDDIEKSIEILKDILSYSSLEYKPNIYIELIKLNQKQYINEFFNLVRDKELQLNSFDPIKYNISTVYEYVALLIIENEEMLLKDFLNFCQNTYREHFSSKCNVLLNTGLYFKHNLKDKEQALNIFNQALVYQSGEEIFSECYKNIYLYIALHYYANDKNIQIFFQKLKKHIDYIVSNELYTKLTYDDYFLLTQGIKRLMSKHYSSEAKMLVNLIDVIIENFDSDNEIFKTLFLDIRHDLCDEIESKLQFSTQCISHLEKHKDKLTTCSDNFQKYLKHLESNHKQYLIMNTERKTFVRSEAKVGRNDPCPCGSGKKYKKCCG